MFFKHSKNTPAESVNKTALFVIRDAQKHTPFVEQSTIDTQLEVSTTPVIGNRGKPLKGKVTYEVPSLGFADKIVMARMNPDSKYSLLTGNRWPVRKIRIKDFAKAYGDENAVQMFMEVIQPITDRMIRARHSSTHYLEHSWADIIKKILPFVPVKYRSGLEPQPSEPNSLTLPSGEVIPAMPGGAIVRCIVSNKIGTAGPNAVLYEKHNAAARAILIPILQQSIDREFESKMKYADAQGWKEEKSYLENCGFLVRMQ